MNEKARKVVKDFVKHRPSHCWELVLASITSQEWFEMYLLTKVAVNQTNIRTKARRRKMSPKGQRNNSPAA
jgi:hypothetical protein